MSSSQIPLTVLSFFCLSLLFFITLTMSLFALCKFSQFIPEAKIAKAFYISIVIASAVRAGCFGATTALYFKEYKLFHHVKKAYNDEQSSYDSYYTLKLTGQDSNTFKPEGKGVGEAQADPGMPRPRMFPSYTQPPVALHVRLFQRRVRTVLGHQPCSDKSATSKN